MLTDLAFDPKGRALTALFAARVAATPEGRAACFHAGGALASLSWRDVERISGASVLRLRAAGATAGSVVGIFLPTGCPWMLADLACLRAGVLSAAYHAGWQLDDLCHAMALRVPRVVVCDAQGRALVEAALARLGIAAVILDADALMQAGPQPLPPQEEPAPGHAATLVFTSGTGGAAKGVLLTHGAMLGAAWHAYHQLGLDGRGAHTLHWLPLSHMFGRLGLYLDWIAGSTACFSRGVEFLAEDLRLARPRVLFAVPQVLSRLRARIEAGARERGVARRLAFALARGGATLALRAAGGRRLALQDWLRRCVFADVHARLGGELRAVIVGGAPVDAADKAYFEALGLAVREGFGMTETAGVAAVQPLRGASIGAGGLLPGLDARISADGELLLRGATMLSCYLNAEAFDADGWFHTGDLATLDARGLRITGRIKDLIIPASGENISPARLEARICRHPWIEDACLVGDGRPCLVAVVVPSAEGRAAGAALEPAIADHLVRLGATLARFERVHAHVRADAPFSVANGMLTVTGKKKRAQIAGHYAAAIDAAYARLRTLRAQAQASGPHPDTPTMQEVQDGKH